jgi:hypothetical protein
VALADDDPAPDLGDCQNLQVPEGNSIAFHALGVGVQIYSWDGMSWNFVAPHGCCSPAPRMMV